MFLSRENEKPEVGRFNELKRRAFDPKLFTHDVFNGLRLKKSFPEGSWF